MDNGIADALEYVGGLKDKLHAASEVEIDGRQYSRGELRPVKQPEIPFIKLCTLTGIVGYCTANVDGLDLSKCLVHVASPTRVELITDATGPFAQRTTVNHAEPLIPSFPFGRFMGAEEFVISVNAMFLENEDRTEVLKSVASIVVSEGNTIKDDGVSQEVSVQAGARMVGTKTLKPRVKLIPYSTFHEVAQPEREFILRLDKNGNPGLFVADGEAWRNVAMESVRAWLSEKLPEMNVIS